MEGVSEAAKGAKEGGGGERSNEKGLGRKKCREETVGEEEAQVVEGVVKKGRGRGGWRGKGRRQREE